MRIIVGLKSMNAASDSRTQTRRANETRCKQKKNEDQSQKKAKQTIENRLLKKQLNLFFEKVNQLKKSSHTGQERKEKVDTN